MKKDVFIEAMEARRIYQLVHAFLFEAKEPKEVKPRTYRAQ